MNSTAGQFHNCQKAAACVSTLQKAPAELREKTLENGKAVFHEDEDGLYNSRVE